MSELSDALGQTVRHVELGGRKFVLRPLTVRKAIEVEREHGALEIYGKTVEGVADILWRCVEPEEGAKPSFDEFLDLVPIGALSTVFEEHGDFITGKAVRK